MFESLSISITNRMERSGVFSPDEKEIYQYGIQQILLTFLNLVTVAIIGLLLGAFRNLLIFTIAYIPLRKMAGGFHAKTPIRCYVVSTAMFVFVALVPRWISIGAFETTILLLVFSVVIIALAPVGSANKPLDDLEKKVYKKRAVVICAVEVIAALVFLHLSVQVVADGIFWAVTMVLVLLLLGKLHYRQVVSNRNSHIE